MSCATLHAAEERLPSQAQQMSKWVDQVLGPTYHSYCPSEGWTPSVNLYEDAKHYCLVVDLAGVKTSDILRVEQGKLIISGTRATPGLEQMAGPVRLHQMEIDHGRFCRTLPVPDDVDVDAIAATYGGGFLWVRLPKKS